MAIYRNAVLIYNPYAGKLRGPRARLVARVVETLDAAGHKVSAVPTEGPLTAGRLARQRIDAGADLVISLGGDGTLNEALNGIAGCSVPLAVIPAGTANVLARELGVGCNAVPAARSLSEWTPQRVGLGLLTAEPGGLRRYFLLMAGIGFDAHIVYRLNVPLKFRLGQLAYWLGAAGEIGRRLDQVEVQAGPEAFSCAFALASRVRNYAGYLQIARRASLLRDDFELVLFEGAGAASLYARYLIPVLLRRPPNVKGMAFMRCREARFTAPPDSRVYVQVDGEYAGRLPASIEIAPGALTLLVPPAFLSRG